jgi:hypothetical protein
LFTELLPGNALINSFTIRYSEARDGLIIESVTFFFDYLIAFPKFRRLRRIEHYRQHFLVNRDVLYAWKTARFARLMANWDAMSPAEVANAELYADITDYFEEMRNSMRTSPIISSKCGTLCGHHRLCRANAELYAGITDNFECVYKLKTANT